MKKLCIAFASLFAISFVQAQTADEIVNKYITAIGGKENIQKIQNVVMSASINVMGKELEMTMTNVNNKLQRVDLNIMGMANYDFATDKAGFSFWPIQGMAKPEPKTAEEIAKGIDELDIEPLLDYKTKGHSVELLGKEDVEGTECLKVKVAFKGGESKTLFFDPTSYMIVKQSSKKNINGQEMEIASTMSDYRDVQGVKMPFSVVSPQGPVTIKEIKVNQVIDEKLYKAE